MLSIDVLIKTATLRIIFTTRCLLMLIRHTCNSHLLTSQLPMKTCAPPTSAGGFIVYALIPFYLFREWTFSACYLRTPANFIGLGVVGGARCSSLHWRHIYLYLHSSYLFKHSDIYNYIKRISSFILYTYIKHKEIVLFKNIYYLKRIHT